MCGKPPPPACSLFFFLVMLSPKSYLIKIQVNLLKRVGEDHVQKNNDVSEKYKMTQPVACVKYNDMSVSCFLFHLQQQETCQYIPKASKRKKSERVVQAESQFYFCAVWEAAITLIGLRIKCYVAILCRGWCHFSGNKNRGGRCTCQFLEKLLQ